MRNIFLVLLFAVCALPVAAPAQFMPTLTPDQQAQVMKLRADTKTASFNALSADHQTKVQAVITQFDSGSVSMPDAITQIDAILTPDESKAVIAQSQQMRDAMRKIFESANGGSPPSGPPGGGQGQPRRAPDAGRILLQLGASPEALRAAMQP
ncbi:MAG TPA: hypothetical protein VFO29_08265 [Candidatus Rubrimentiphilum sp.]|nr:hypothetical protein [Candidatus Rubrimentiphilum sp.]